MSWNRWPVGLRHSSAEGQQQRVALARALAYEPRLLLLDEPLSNLDAKLRVQMRLEIKEVVNRLGLTSLYVTHDQEEALAISDRIAVMDSGLIEQQGTPDKVYSNPATAFVAGFVGKSNFVNGTAEEINQSGVHVRCAGAPSSHARATAPPTAFRGVTLSSSWSGRKISSCAAATHGQPPMRSMQHWKGPSTWVGGANAYSALVDDLLDVEFHGRNPLALGESATLAFPPEIVRVFL